MTQENHAENRRERGFYAGDFNTRELRDLENTLDGGLEGEIHMMRVAIRRFFKMGGQAKDLDEAGCILRTLGTAVVRLADLCKTQEMLGRKADQALKEINQALQEVLDELRSGL